MNPSFKQSLELFNSLVEQQMNFIKRASVAEDSSEKPPFDFFSLSKQWEKSWREGLASLGRKDGEDLADAGEIRRRLETFFAGFDKFLPPPMRGLGGFYSTMGEMSRLQSELFERLTEGNFEGEEPEKLLEGFREGLFRTMTEHFPFFDLSFMGGGFAGNSGDLLEAVTRRFFEFGQETLKGFPAGTGSRSDGKTSDAEKADELAAAYAARARDWLGKSFAFQRLGQNGPLMAKVREYLESLIAYQECQIKFSGRLNRALEKGSAKVGEAFENPDPEDPRLKTGKAFFKFCLASADSALAEALATEDFARLQSELLSAWIRLKTRFNALNEEALKESAFATKSEVDEAYRSIRELKKTVADLTARLAAVETKGQRDVSENVAEPSAASADKKTEKKKEAAPKKTDGSERPGPNGNGTPSASRND